MVVFKKDSLLCLALLVSSAGATNFSDPIICYVLDAVLLFYCIIFTALYFKLKFRTAFARESTNNGPEAKQERIYEQPLRATEEHYEEFRVKNQAPSSKDPQSATQPRKKKNKTKHSQSKSHAAEAIELTSVPALPARE
ncbi:CD247 antigen like [Tachysurus fulvidraco]|uniref:CD247 antigen like n=1 Tax=Tachysurus fulvidraco TaxID=1234273 RepID=UPI000F4D4DD1|nr:CD247 antigen like [Tachysurus fulvidraco]